MNNQILNNNNNNNNELGVVMNNKDNVKKETLNHTFDIFRYIEISPMEEYGQLDVSPSDLLDGMKNMYPWSHSWEVPSYVKITDDDFTRFVEYKGNNMIQVDGDSINYDDVDFYDNEGVIQKPNDYLDDIVDDFFQFMKRNGSSDPKSSEWYDSFNKNSYESEVK